MAINYESFSVSFSGFLLNRPQGGRALLVGQQRTQPMSGGIKGVSLDGVGDSLTSPRIAWF